VVESPGKAYESRFLSPTLTVFDWVCLDGIKKTNTNCISGKFLYIALGGGHGARL
jgi:hypothetical protein